jgi:hypothetical protein
MPVIPDPDVEFVAAFSTRKGDDYTPPGSASWKDSPFEWLLTIPPATRGAFGKELVTEWASANGFQVSTSKSRVVDRLINGHRIAIKLSRLWRDGEFHFQQIRNQDYDFLFCVGLSPDDVQAWLLPKEVLLQYVIGHMGQHTGASARDTDWLRFKPDSPHEWMAPFGDRLSDIARLLTTLDQDSTKAWGP